MVEITLEAIKSSFNRLRECKKVWIWRGRMEVALVIQLASREKIAVNLPSRDQLVPMVLVESEAELSGELEFRGTIYYPFRIGGTGGLEFPERCVQGVLDLRCKPLVLIDGDRVMVAVYYAPGPEAVPMSSVELVAT